MAVVTKGRAASSYEDFFSGDVGLWWKLRDVATEEVVWHIVPPCGHAGEVLAGPASAHTVVEHSDDSITVGGSIICRACGWHGFLEAGEWREV